MKKELYEKPEIEIISLLNVDIITESAEEGGDVPVEDDENANGLLNETDLCPWVKDENGEGCQEGTEQETGGEQGGGLDIIDGIKDIIIPSDDISEGTPIEDNIIPSSENIQEEIPAEDDINNIE